MEYRHEDFLIDEPKGAPAATVVLAHGAGAAMDSAFMVVIAAGLAANKMRVVRFEFPYMHARRTGAKRGAPDREPKLLDAWRAVVAALGGGPQLVLGGKSMGGRIATMVADEVAARALVCFGYPFHPPGNTSRLRVKHLESMRTPALIVQGERDSFGKRDEIAHYKLSPRIRFAWMTDGDHSLKPRASSGRTEAQNLEAAISAAADFINALLR
jgi:predicted alpha/beta-hydrolase family hydrolase